MFFDISSFPRTNLAPPSPMPPRCFRCGGPSERMTTRNSNRKGNAGRPYDKCTRCKKFLGFADERGNDPNNPPCHCGVSSRRQLAGPEKQVPYGLHYVCRLGACDFYAPYTNAGNQQVTVSRELVDCLATLQII